jgi:glutathione S-transferase
MITLYTAATPNGWKASCTLEELEIPYQTHAIDMGKNQQKEEWYLEICPNGRIPAIVDDDVEVSTGDGDGQKKPLAIFESGAIMIYLADKAGRLIPSDTAGRSQAIQWLMFQMGGIGPMMGQANVFYRYFPEKIQAAIDRYQHESRRLFEVLERRLGESQWLAGDEFSIADIANWSWVRIHGWSGVSTEGLPHLETWVENIEARPGCQRGLTVPTPMRALEQEPDEETARSITEQAQKMLQR